MTSKTILCVLLAAVAAMSVGCGEATDEPAGDFAETYPTTPPVIEFYLTVAFEPPDPALDLRHLHEEFHRQGPQAAPPALRWLPIKDLDQWHEELPEILSYPEGIRSKRTTDPETYFKVTRGLVVDVYNGRPYMLVYASDDKCMMHDADEPWEIVAARRVTDYLHHSAIELQFDEAGTLLYDRLYDVIEGKRYAILVDGKVISAGHMTQWFRPSPSIMVAEISEDEIRALIRRFN